MTDDGGGAASGRNRATDSSAAVTTPSGRCHLGRDLILRFIDERGQERLTMRRLGLSWAWRRRRCTAMCRDVSNCSMESSTTSPTSSRDAFADEFDDALHDLIKRVASFHS